MKKPLKLNLGSGSNHIEGYISIDAELSCKPHVCMDFTKDKLPYRDNSVDEVIFFHCIEHIQKVKHSFILSEIHRVLKSTGTVFISYPEFSVIAKNWLENKAGKRKFWENTIYGLQRFPADFHVSAMDSKELSWMMKQLGFVDIQHTPEDQEHYNSLITAGKGTPFTNYENLLKKDMKSIQLRQV